MKITDIRTFPLCAGGRNFLFVKVETDEGLYGMGEFGITWREQAGIGAIEHMKPHLLGQDQANIEFLWQLMFRGDFFPGGRIGSSFLEDVFPVQVPYEAGHVLPPERPGLGIEFDEKAAFSYEFKWLRGPQLRRSDGSFTNW